VIPWNQYDRGLVVGLFAWRKGRSDGPYEFNPKIKVLCSALVTNIARTHKKINRVRRGEQREMPKPLVS
jgi:hypothetical protein